MRAARGKQRLDLEVKFVAVGSVLVDDELQLAGDPCQGPAAGPRHHHVAKGLLARMQRAGLLEREASFAAVEPAMECFDPHVAGFTVLWVAHREHDARSGGLKIPAERLGEIETINFSLHLRGCRSHGDLKGPACSVHGAESTDAGAPDARSREAKWSDGATVGAMIDSRGASDVVLTGAGAVPGTNVPWRVGGTVVELPRRLRERTR